MNTDKSLKNLKKSSNTPKPRHPIRKGSSKRTRKARKRPSLNAQVKVTILRGIVPFCDMVTMSGTYGKDKISMSFDPVGGIFLRWDRPGGMELFGVKSLDLIRAVMNEQVAEQLVKLADLEGPNVLS